MATRKRICFGFILASLITAITLYFKTSVLIKGRHCCFMITDITDTDGYTDNAAKDMNERMLDHHPKKDLPLNNSVNPILPTTIPKLVLIHDSKPPNDPSSAVSHSEAHTHLIQVTQ